MLGPSTGCSGPTSSGVLHAHQCVCVQGWGPGPGGKERGSAKAVKGEYGSVQCADILC